MLRLAIAVGALLIVWVGLWALALLLVRFLPEGAVRSALSMLPSTITLFHRLIRNKAVPRRARLVLFAGLLYAVSPVTIIPDFIPVVGKLDNFLALYLALRWSSTMIPLDLLTAAWPGQPARLTLLVGKRAAGVS